jgi:GntR family transcriptional regulator
MGFRYSKIHLTCSTSLTARLAKLVLEGKARFILFIMNISDRIITSKSTEKIPAYVPIYNMLYSNITNGLYKDGEMIPSESVLTEKYGVSRHTLRMALAILNEDGLIQKHQGKGSIVTSRRVNMPASGQRLFNPIIQCSKEEIDSIDISYNYGPPTEIAQRKLGILATDMVMAINNIYSSNGLPVGHTFIQIPVKHIEDIHFKISSKEDVSILINKTIFELAESAKMTIRLVYAEENITTFLQIKPNQPVIYIEEILFKASGEGLARCKFYFLPDKYEISVTI